MMRYGLPEIFNTEQGSQFTSNEFTSLLEGEMVRISMDGKGRALEGLYQNAPLARLQTNAIILPQPQHIHTPLDSDTAPTEAEVYTDRSRHRDGQEALRGFLSQLTYHDLKPGFGPHGILLTIYVR